MFVKRKIGCTFVKNKIGKKIRLDMFLKNKIGRKVGCMFVKR